MTQTSAVHYVSRLGLAGGGGHIWRFCISHIDGFLSCICLEVVTGAVMFEREDQNGRIRDGGASGFKATPASARFEYFGTSGSCDLKTTTNNSVIPSFIISRLHVQVYTVWISRIVYSVKHPVVRVLRGQPINETPTLETCDCESQGCSDGYLSISPSADDQFANCSFRLRTM
jgi:hypothetical protein